MRFCVLGSGSKGNSTYVASGETAVLIDAGFSAREIERRLRSREIDPASLSAILVTHEHGDHVRGVAVLAKRHGLPVYANAPTWEAAGPHLSEIADFREFRTGASFQIRDLSIHPFSVSHDSADPVGFTVRDGRHTLGYCTDTGMVSRLMRHHLSSCNALVLESNHDLEMLRNSHYPPQIQQRIRSNRGHLANPEAVALLDEVLHDALRHVVLAHLSDTNNRQEVVEAAVHALLEGRAAAGRPVVSIAGQDDPGDLVRMDGHRES